MRCIVRVPSGLWREASRHLLVSPSERMAYLLARASRWDDPWRGPTTDLLVRRALLVPDAALLTQSPTRLEVEPAFTQEVLRACYETGMSLIDVHTHPFSSGPVWFSSHDETNMQVTHREFATMMPDEPVAAAASLVLGPGGLAGAWCPDPDDVPKSLDMVTLAGVPLTDEWGCAA
ncbi:hypothetical protein BJF79_28985 [Actinomadura sp. CNU-125]|uniref:hypothetical protein n=1 Tax=Actinomadura sp. CNU-125 TaxID=1904961 RepID=UPI00095F1E95|nr:hypothetical protein [Actinomadura sp. CNU-125]OLT37839.1 hypothetical protein BJF79_28985 [Actinomadura sp. CNU-125]